MESSTLLSRRSAVRLFTALALAGAMPETVFATSTKADGLAGLGAQMGKHDYTLICEPDHKYALKNLDLIGSKEFLDNARTVGVDTIGFELPTEWQTDVDRLGLGAAYRSDFIEQMENFAPNFLKPDQTGPFREKIADMIEHTREWGKVVFYDNSTTEPAMQKYIGFFADHMSELEVDGNATDKQLWKAAIKFGKRHKTEINSLMHDIVVDRITPAENRLLLDNLEGNAKDGRKLIVVGVEHAAAMKKLLEEENKTVGVVVLHPSRHEYRASAKAYAKGEFAVDMTGYDHFMIDSGRFVAAQPKNTDPVQTVAPPMQTLRAGL